MLYNISYTNTIVFYCLSTVITKDMLLYNTEWWYDHGMAVNFHWKKLYNTGPWLNRMKTVGRKSLKLYSIFIFFESKFFWKENLSRWSFCWKTLRCSLFRYFMLSMGQSREYWRGKYHCTVDLLFDRFGLVCFANKNKKRQLSYSWFQTSQTGGQWYSDTSPFSIPWPIL